MCDSYDAYIYSLLTSHIYDRYESMYQKRERENLDKIVEHLLDKDLS